MGLEAIADAQAVSKLDGISAYFCVVAGIVISLILPILRRALPKSEYAAAGDAGSRIEVVWTIAKPYLAIGCFSALTGILIVAMAGETMSEWRMALLSGYGWDSTIQKFLKR